MGTDSTVTLPLERAARAQRQASDPLASVWVGASAGTGKTKVLTDRVLRLLLNGTDPKRLLCLTFTRAAAAEMAGRISGVLADWTILDDAGLRARLTDLLGREPDPDTPGDADLMRRARQLFALTLDTPGGMRILTIHSFCQTVLKRFPLEAGVPPHFEILSEREAQALKTGVRENLAHVIDRSRDEAPELVDAWTTLSLQLDEDRFQSLLGELMTRRDALESALAEHGGIDGLVEAIFEAMGLEPGDTPEALVRAAFAPDALDRDSLRDVARAMLECTTSATDSAKGQRLLEFLALEPDALDVAGFDDYADVFVTKTSGEIRKTLCTKPTEDRAPGSRAILETEARRVLELSSRLRAASVACSSAALFRVASVMLGDYARQKQALGRLDYEDLILSTRRLLTQRHAAAWVLYKLDGGLDHLLIDEAQDTSPEQWSIARMLADAFFDDLTRWDAEQPRTIFAVGDRKQSIYGFQGADPRVFDAMRNHFADQIEALEGRFETVPLNTSFRSSEPVLTLVNQVFRTSPARDGVAEPDEDITHLSARTGDGGLVELWPCIVPAGQEPPLPWKPPVEALAGESARGRLAFAVASRIRRMITSGEVLESRGRPIGAGDIMVLLRQRSGFENDLVSALKALDVPVAGVDRMMLLDQIAIMDLMALGKVMLLPEDDLSLAAFLKSPLGGVSEDELFELAHGRRRGERLWSRLRLRAGTDTASGRALAFLEPLRAIAARVTPYAFYSHVLDGPPAGRTALLSRLGAEAEDAIDEFLALALSFEHTEVPSLQGFLHWTERGEAEVKRDLDQGAASAVRIMTVHGSKGLQAPIVFLPDTCTLPRGLQTLFWTRSRDGRPVGLWCPRAADREERIQELYDEAARERSHEYRRLLYVAMTRAADRLYVCGWKTRQTRKDAETESWYALTRSAMEDIATPHEDEHLVRDGLPTEPVLRYERKQKREVAPTPAPAAAPAVPAPVWLHRPAPQPRLPGIPLRPSQLFDETPPCRSPLEAEAGGASRFQRGRLIHRLLQMLPDFPPSEREAAAVAWLTLRGQDQSAEDAHALAREVLAVLEDPSCRMLFADGSRAEVPLTGRIGNHVVSGQIDRLAVTGTEVLVADYKTNRPPPKTADGVAVAYLRQMAAYRRVLEDIFPEKTVRCFIVWTDGPRLMELPAERLDEQVARLFALGGA
ncbi:double-strand break repair helicase AddA [Phaeovibrio sulfidiphilus]|uniref:DNA 3'-5' helicase n=1 Tax=Phaeovibrio sulfidiphilus TaxID=1220600 RepID=A0A8J7CPG4_9PROT|nr:double-strand break repair helicase AddA [Phaeovibrio sulfidiphilus]MBE1236992.1 double-strand break repair helicase AddA [Phaeovibrio sulfidiphilus]